MRSSYHKIEQATGSSGNESHTILIVNYAASFLDYSCPLFDEIQLWFDSGVLGHWNKGFILLQGYPAKKVA